MRNEAWLPIQYEIVPGIKVGQVLFYGHDWQIVKAKGLASKLLIASTGLAKSWIDAGLLENGQYDIGSFGSKELFLISSDERVFAPIHSCPEPNDKYEAMGFASAIKRTRQKDTETPLSSGIYCEKLAIILPVSCPEEIFADDLVLGSYLTGGVIVSCHSERRLLSLVPWLTKDDLSEICSSALLSQNRSGELSGKDTVTEKKAFFQLIGRPALEAFFRDHIIDIIEKRDHYKKLGVDSPSAVILHGPPGCGKTFAVEALVEYLDLPSFTISSGSIGSPYIHETGRKIADVFENAIKQAPSVIIIDEMEAFLSDREYGGQSHRVEEVAEFLRKIPEALKNQVLIIGMTNRIEIIDPAILRRGRFDHVISVDMPMEEEVRALLLKLFSERPHEPSISLDEAVKVLVGRPLSDVSFLVREAARITAKAGKDRIDNANIQEALKLVVREKEIHKPSIGFQ